MKEYCETGETKKKRYWHWVVLVGVVPGLFAIALATRRYQGDFRPKVPTDISSIMQSLCEYSMANNGSYPATLQPLVMQDANGHCYLEGYNGQIPKDPWKREYALCGSDSKSPAAARLFLRR